MILNRHDAAKFFALGESTFRREVSAGRKPKPRQVSPGRVGWLLADLEAHAAHLTNRLTGELTA